METSNAVTLLKGIVHHPSPKDGGGFNAQVRPISPVEHALLHSGMDQARSRVRPTSSTD